MFVLSNVLGARLQREEEAAYASSHGAQTQSHSQSTAPQSHPGHASLGPFSKFEEKKTNEKTRKVTTVKKFFSPSSRTAPKKGVTFTCVYLSYDYLLLLESVGLNISSFILASSITSAEVVN